MKSRGPTTAEKVAFLKRPASFGGAGRGVRAIETHFAWVFLVGNEAWKLKKPVRHRQMDYRSLTARERSCLEEVRLNRRLAPSVYRAAVPLTFSRGTLALGGKGEIVDWLIRMRRLPEAKMLDHALSARSVRATDVDRIARTLACFFESAPAHPVSGARYVGRLARDIRANAREIGRCSCYRIRRSAREVRARQLAALAKLRPMLAARGACVVEGHGDLRAEHVHIGRRIAIIDALEFDRELRLLDPAEEVSLLALEIERLGQRALADRLIERFRRETSSVLPDPVFWFYKSQRAATRAKLAAWHIDDPQFPDPRPWIARTESLLTDALRYARAACGLQQMDSLDTSATKRRPAMQRRERSAGAQATHSCAEDWGHMQFR